MKSIIGEKQLIKLPLQAERGCYAIGTMRSKKRAIILNE
ncbi:hypothetical protein ADICYQ_4228 [Cyclobacterium qasimii M12-11B]|uniref:Uncharacterized protein n=1 Tax=Cyclobacterium qasimii M12-11B TaxID=641524 RepID=S7VA38_9BACT|nr:hypothetical protein ADICYQ_4228 [Cyclobacterium qasimii M12-11B]